MFGYQIFKTTFVRPPHHDHAPGEKPGRAARYVRSKIEPVFITPKNFLFSYYNEDGERIEIRF